MTERKLRTSERNQRFAPKRPQGRPYRGAPGDDDDDGPLWLYGHHAAAAALSNPRRKIHRLVATLNAARQIETDLTPEIMTPRDIDKLMPEGAVHQGIAVFADPLDQPFLKELLKTGIEAPLIVLDQVTDPHNVGAILRSASAFGAAAVVTTRRNSAPVTGVLAKAASGALEHMPYLQMRNLAEALETLADAGYVRLGLDERGERLLGEALPGSAKVALVFGAEGAGLRQKTKETCDALVRLPTSGPVGALNVSNAVAVSLYAVNAQSGA